MMLTEITDLREPQTILAAIPESLELFLFGVGLVVAVVVLRWFLDRGEVEKEAEEFNKKRQAKRA